MYVVADLESLQNHRNEQCPTQLAAIRVDKEWAVVDSFFAYIRPADSTFHDWQNAAFTGGEPMNFLSAKRHHDIFESFEKWLHKDDVLCWWYQESEELYRTLTKTADTNNHARKMIILSKYMRGFLDGQGHVKGSQYKLARARDIVVPEIEHDARNDVEAILNLIKGINFPQAALEAPPIKPLPKYNHPHSEKFAFQYDVTNGLLHKKRCRMLPQGVDRLGHTSLTVCVRNGYKPCECVRADYFQTKRQIAIETIENMPYTFLYAAHGKIYHRRDCHALYNVNRIWGTTRLDTIKRLGLRPCKICKPTDDLEIKPPRKPEKRVKRFIKAPPKVQLTPERIALKRYERSRQARFSGKLEEAMQPQERQDLYTLTQPRFAFFAAHGYQNFHLESCPNMVGKTDLIGFETYSKARNAGYTPCRKCKPTDKLDVTVSIPIGNQPRPNETIEDLVTLCKQFGYSYNHYSYFFEIQTPVGKWRINTSSNPVTVEHINLVKTPNSYSYHQQPRIFLSKIDAVNYIRKHDEHLARSVAETDENNLSDTEEADI